MTSSTTETPARGPVWAVDAARRDRDGAPSLKGLVVNVLALAVVAVAIAFFAAPGVAFYAIRSAAETSDVGGLVQLIDYDAVRGALRPQISGRVEPLSPPPSLLKDPIGAIRRQFDTAVTPPAPDSPDVDVYLTPAALAALTRGEGRRAPAGSALAGGPTPRPIYWGVNRARLAVPGQDGTRTVFTFERRGPFEWKLVHLGLPVDSFATPPAAP